MDDPTTEREDVTEVLRRVKDIGSEQSQVADDLAKDAKSVSIPLVLVIVAFITALVSLGGWSLTIETRKADKLEVAAALEKKVDRVEIMGALEVLSTKIDTANKNTAELLRLHPRTNALGK